MVLRDRARRLNAQDKFSLSQIFRSLVTGTLVLILTGCTIGNGRICGPQTPAAYCDAEALSALLYPKPYIERWIKPGVSSDQKMLDWIACGGSQNGRFSPSEKELETWTTPEDPSTIRAFHSADDQFQRCVLSKGFVWVGRCDFSHSKTMPACGAP